MKQINSKFSASSILLQIKSFTIKKYKVNRRNKNNLGAYGNTEETLGGYLTLEILFSLPAKVGRSLKTSFYPQLQVFMKDIHGLQGAFTELFTFKLTCIS